MGRKESNKNPDYIGILLDFFYSAKYKKYIKPSTIILFSTITVVVLFAGALKSMPKDFYAYYTAAQIALHDKQNLYNPQVQAKTQEELFKPGWYPDKGYMAFINLPLSALIYVPLLVIPPGIAGELSHVFTALITLYCIVRLYRFHSIKILSWITLAVAALFPIYASAHLGQISILILVVLVEMYICFTREKSTVLGLVSSLLIFKYQYLILAAMVFAICPNKKNFLKGFLPPTLLILTLNFYFMWPTLFPEFISLLKMYSQHPEDFGMSYVYGIDLLSAFSVFIKDINIQPTILGFIIATHATLFVFLLTVNSNYKEKSNIFYFLIMYSLVMSPHAMPADHVFLLIPLIGILRRVKNVLFGILTVLTLNALFYVSSFGHQWLHTAPLLTYSFLLLSSTLKKPGKIGRWVQNSMVGDPGLEPGTARV